MKLSEIKVGQYVYDSWWPWNTAVVRKKTRSSVWVEWVSGETRRVDRYDKAHVQFLVRKEVVSGEKRRGRARGKVGGKG